MTSIDQVLESDRKILEVNSDLIGRRTRRTLSKLCVFDLNKVRAFIILLFEQFELAIMNLRCEDKIIFLSEVLGISKGVSQNFNIPKMVDCVSFDIFIWLFFERNAPHSI